ncbi:ATP-binding cassette domain-containing protein [Kitasatospora sp. NPDC049258]|uniref:ATP-binding cassette domain-containing protein n=1 Tax=Kitasatospora sp. NPDC049258 TaxID=3155394 RepID=UPI0034481948
MSAGPAAGLSAHGLVRRFGGATAVDGVDLSVPPGRITALVGPNGAGKSTLFDCLSGAARADGGLVRLDGRDITRLPDHARARLGLARTFQQPAVFPGLTVGENVRVGAEQRTPGTVRGLLGLPPAGRAQARAATTRALRLLGLEAVRDRPAADLPTGALRLLELARALAADPRVLLLDEPTAGLDTAQTEHLAAVLRALAAEGLAVLLVEHDAELVAELAHTAYVLAAGQVVLSGPARAVLTDRRVTGLWGGR